MPNDYYVAGLANFERLHGSMEPDDILGRPPDV